MNLNVHPVNFNSDDKLISLIEEKVKKLNIFNDTITSVDVYLKLEGSHAVRDKVVEIKVNVLKNQIFVKEQTKTFEESLSIALDSAISQLRKKKEILKG